MRRIALLIPLTLAFSLALVHADGPGDNLPDNVRPIPPRGDTLPAEVKSEIESGLKELQQLIKDIGKHELLPDVQVYEKAVRWALEYNEVFDPKNTKNPGANVKAVLKSGLERAKALKEGKTPWTTATGTVVRGYKSKIDGSAQPYGLVIPKDYDFKGDKKHRLDYWWHGRGENLSEANFIADREKNAGQFTPAGAIVVHPYGRYCNANKFAGETDSLEILDHMKKHYRIDESRIVARGFSMGGAACWQYAVHYPSLFCAAAPGAGFAETKEFLNNFQGETVKPEWWEEKLWRMYDATVYAQNIFNIPTVAYSGEIDKQKQAADVMAREMKKVGLELTHIIGPKTGHSYEKGAKLEVEKLVDAHVEKGLPKDRKEIKFVTYTLRYNRCDWVIVTGLEKHWEKGSVTGTITDGTAEVKTEGVAALDLNFSDKSTKDRVKKVVIDGKDVSVSTIPDSLHLRKRDGKWVQLLAPPEKTPIGAKGELKYPGLQGPIDDAFLDAFIMVKPTGTPVNEALGKWTEKEMTHAVKHWRSQFRGDAPTKNDKDITDEDIKNNNLILWGDPKSNAILAKIADKLPLKEFDEKHTTLLIYPNPLNPKKYVVLNSGFTFREYDYLNNARQVSKLPDYAVLDITTPANSRLPGKVVRAGFFDEQWKLQKDDGK